MTRRGLCAAILAVTALVQLSISVAAATSTASPAVSPHSGVTGPAAGSSTSVRIVIALLLLGAAFLMLLRRRNQGPGRRG